MPQSLTPSEIELAAKRALLGGSGYLSTGSERQARSQLDDPSGSLYFGQGDMQALSPNTPLANLPRNLTPASYQSPNGNVGGQAQFFPGDPTNAGAAGLLRFSPIEGARNEPVGYTRPNLPTSLSLPQGGSGLAFQPTPYSGSPVGAAPAGYTPAPAPAQLPQPMPQPAPQPAPRYAAPSTATMYQSQLPGQLQSRLPPAPSIQPRAATPAPRNTGGWG